MTSGRVLFTHERASKTQAPTRIHEDLAEEPGDDSVEALVEAWLRPGDELKVEVEGPGRIALDRSENPLLRYTGSLSRVYPPDYLEELRGEWEHGSDSREPGLLA